jgi:hypothetical protein
MNIFANQIDIPRGAVDKVVEREDGGDGVNPLRQIHAWGDKLINQ